MVAQGMLVCALRSLHLPITSPHQTMPRKNLNSPFLHTNRKDRLISKFCSSNNKSMWRRHAATSTDDGDDAVTTFDWKTAWYPVIPIQDLNPDTPNKITLLGMDLVMWLHRPSNTWRAFHDSCPHRMVPLSEGQVESTGVLQCAYHGWEFDKEGVCLRIPQIANCTNSPAIFSTSEESLAASKELPLIPELEDPECVDATNFFVRDMTYSWQILVEKNRCDPAHVNFAHHSFMGGANRNQENQVLEIKVTKEDSQGFKAQKDPYPSRGTYDVKFEPKLLVSCFTVLRVTMTVF